MTRTLTDDDLTGIVSPLSDADLVALSAAIGREQGLRSERDERQREYAAWLASAEATAEQGGQVPFAPVPHFGHLPGQVIIYEDQQWRNTSGAYLTVGPAEYPLGWAQIITEDTEVLPWAEGESIEGGDLREYDGVIYRAIQAHTTQAGWTPPAVPALWVAQEAENA